MIVKNIVRDFIILPLVNTLINEIYGNSKGILNYIRKKRVKRKLKNEFSDEHLKRYGSENIYNELKRLGNDNSILDDIQNRCYYIDHNDYRTNDEFILSISNESELSQKDKNTLYKALKFIFDKTFNILNRYTSEDTRITVNEIRILRNDIKKLSKDIEEISNNLRLNDDEKIKELNNEIEKLKEEIQNKDKKLKELYRKLKELLDGMSGSSSEDKGIKKFISWLKCRFGNEISGKKLFTTISVTVLVLLVIVLGSFWMSQPKKREIPTELIPYSDISLDYLKNISTTDSETVRIDFYDVIDVNNLKVVYNDTEIYEYDVNYFDILPEYLDQLVDISVSAYQDDNLVETINLYNVYVVNDYNVSRIASGVERIYFKGSVNSLMAADLTNNESIVEIFFRFGNDFTEDILCGLTNLKSLYIGSTSEKDTKFLKNILYLENLQIFDCPNLKNINSLEYLCNLRILELRRCSHLSEIKGLTWLTNLVSIDIIDSYDLKDIRAMENLINLEHLYINYCRKIEDISVLGNLTELKFLYLTDCSGIDNITALESLTKLKILNLSDSGNFDVREILALSDSIEEIVFDTSMVTSDLNDFCNRFTNLTVLYLNSCNNIDELRHLNRLVHLEYLKIKSYYGEDLYDFDFYNSFPNINTLELIYCNNLTDISTIANIENLDKLTLSNCGKIANIDCLSELTSLSTLNLESCKSVNDISALSELNNLEHLNLRYCSSISDISSLASLSNLEYLNLYYCENIIDFSPLDNLTETEIYGVEGY